MIEISVLRAIPEIERKERQAKAFVLRDVPQLVTPHGGCRFDACDDHVAERDRAEAAPGQHEVRESAIAHVKKAAVPTPRSREGEQAKNVSDRIGMVRDEGAADRQGMDATTSSTAARTRSRVVSEESKRRVMVFPLRSASTDATPSMCLQPATMCSAQL